MIPHIIELILHVYACFVLLLLGYGFGFNPTLNAGERAREIFYIFLWPVTIPYISWRHK